MTREPLSADIDRAMTYLKKLRSLAEESQKHEKPFDDVENMVVMRENEQRGKEEYNQV